MSEVHKNERQDTVKALRTMLTGIAMSSGKDIAQLGVLGLLMEDPEALAGARIAQDMADEFLLNMNPVTFAGFLGHAGALALSTQAALDEYSAEVAVS